MFQMYIDGVTLRDIADSMNNAGMCPQPGMVRA